MHKFTDKGHTDTQMAEGFLPKIGVFIWKHVSNKLDIDEKINDFLMLILIFKHLIILGHQ